MDGDELAALGFDLVGSDIIYRGVVYGRCLAGGKVSINESGLELIEQLKTPPRRTRKKRDEVADLEPLA